MTDATQKKEEHAMFNIVGVRRNPLLFRHTWLAAI